MTAAPGTDSAIVFSGIVPHPPIMVPEVGGDAVVSVQASIAAMAELTRRIIESGAETVVLISPHAPLDARAFVAYHSPKLSGDFANFRAPNTRVEFVVDEELLAAITEIAGRENYEVLDLENYQLDHGSAVPLYFLDRNGWRGRVVALGYSFLSDDDHLKFGNCIRSAAEGIGRPIAFVASGDLSHRLKPEAPAGYNTAAQRFDNEVVEAINNGSPEEIIAIDQDLRRLAGECGYRSMLVALGVSQKLPRACEVLSYEAPFGVGYLVAQLTNISAAARNDDGAIVTHEDFDPAIELPALARLAIETFVQTGEEIAVPEKASPLLSVRAACFVSIKTHTGDLRGCIGTVEPVKQNLGEELIANAINAASRDPRFDPVSIDELADLRYSVDILTEPEPATFADLDPKTYGVIVSDESETRRGLLLPDISGVETAEQQVGIAARKAGIPPETPLKLLRFRVDRYREKK
ncbi:MAG TPA: AmmeMemoRadiSam system protein A [Pyrinomonadaceae bacterium]|nr:AmmeMemoRadiSam system protein A [Pyrinomonadaceae bacterium]